VLFALLLMFIAIISWHVFIALLGGAFVIGATAWSVVVGSVFAMCVGILLLFLFTGIGILLLGLIAAIWTIVAIALFPVLFPILAPIFIIFLVISYFCRNNEKKS
jgi:hypothetical protein